jgi:hypothetical protein
MSRFVGGRVDSCTGRCAARARLGYLCLVSCVLAAMPLALASCGGPAAKSGGNPQVTKENFDKLPNIGGSPHHMEKIIGEPDSFEDGPPFQGFATRIRVYRGVHGEQIRIRVLNQPLFPAKVLAKNFLEPSEAGHAEKPASERIGA